MIKFLICSQSDGWVMLVMMSVVVACRLEISSPTDAVTVTDVGIVIVER